MKEWKHCERICLSHKCHAGYGIALTAATVCTACACTKRLVETQWPETRDKTYWAETETYCSKTETRPETRLSEMRPRWDVSTFWDRLETETSRLRPHSWLLGYQSFHTNSETGRVTWCCDCATESALGFM